MSIELISYLQDENSGELYATPPNGKCLIGKITNLAKQLSSPLLYLSRHARRKKQYFTRKSRKIIIFWNGGLLFFRTKVHLKKINITFLYHKLGAKYFFNRLFFSKRFFFEKPRFLGP